MVWILKGAIGTHVYLLSWPLLIYFLLNKAGGFENISSTPWGLKAVGQRLSYLDQGWTSNSVSSVNMTAALHPPSLLIDVLVGS